MCKHHDQFHYPSELREAASTLAKGRPTTRDALLAIATHTGLIGLRNEIARYGGLSDTERVKTSWELARFSINHSELVQILEERLQDGPSEPDDLPF